MSVTTETNRSAELTTDGVETEFDFDMLIHADTEVQVWYQVTGGDYTQLTLDTHYTVIFTEDGGTVTTIGGSSPYAAGKLLIIRHLPITQQTNWLYNDAHTEQTHQDDFDRSVMRDLQIQEQLDRAVSFAIHSGTIDIEFPEPEASTVIGWNAAGTALENRTALTSLDYTDGNFMVGDGSDWIVESGNTARTSLGLGTGDSPTWAGATFTGVVTGVIPTAGEHFATKEYVDLALGTSKTFFLSDSGSGIGDLNYAYPHETGEVQSEIANDGGGEAYGVGTHLHQGFITEAGEPATTTIHEGVLEIHFHAKKGAGNHRITTLHVVISRVDADGTTSKTTVATSEVTAELTDTETEYTIHAALGSDIEITSTVRLICDIYANVTTGARDSVVTLYMEGAEDSYFTTRVDSGIWQNYGDVLDDLNTLGQVGADSEFLVGTAAGVLDWENAATARTSLGLTIGTDVLAEQTIGIADDNLLEVDGTPNSGEYARFTADGLEGRTLAEMEGELDHDNLVNFVANKHINWTGATDDFYTTGKVRIRDDAAVKPTGESDGYISVYESGATRRFYTFVGGLRYYVNLTADAEAVPGVGNPIGLLLALTYAA